MRRRYIIITLIMLLSFSFVIAKTHKNQPASPDTVKLQLITPLRQDIQINCVNLDRKFYIIDKLELSRNDISNRRTCFLLNDDFKVSEVTVDRYAVQLKLYKNVRNTDFNPPLDVQLNEKLNGKCRVYELFIPDKANLSENFTLKLKYHIPETDSAFVITAGKDWIDFKGTDFCYPRNPGLNENISMYVKTTDENSFYVNGKSIEYTQTRYLKEYKTSFIDMADSPAVLMFRKTRLK
jgi:hypothetical protein